MEEEIETALKPKIASGLSTKPKKTWRKNTAYFAPDGGWAWLVLLGQFTISVLFSNVGPLFGIVFVHLVKELDLTSVIVAWIFNIQAMVWNITAIMAGPLCKEFGWRPVAMTGSFMGFIGMLLTCFASSSVVIFITFSVMLGFGGSLTFSTGSFIVPHYFVARRGLAIAIASSGISFGSFCLPLLVGFLQEYYGFDGAALIYSSIFLHAFLGATLFHPLHWHTQSTLAEGEQMVETAPDSKPKIYELATLIAKQMGRNVASLKSPVVFILSVSGAVYIIAFLNVMMMIPFSLMASGFTIHEVTQCVSFSGISNFICRLSLPTLSDFKWFNKTACYVLGILIVSTSTAVFTCVESYTGVAITLSFLGAGIGASMGLQSLILIEYKGLETLPVTYGAFAFVSCIVFVVIGPSVGWIRDLTQSYNFSYRVLSGVLFCGAAIWLFMPASIRFERKQQEQNNQDQT